MTDTLKPCPFCGGSPTRHKENLGDRNAYAYRIDIECSSCGASIFAEGDRSRGGYADNSTVEKRASEAWNRRTP
jgi:Lar family restriction alleviation protein